MNDGFQTVEAAAIEAAPTVAMAKKPSRLLYVQLRAVLCVGLEVDLFQIVSVGR
jgi:hypothetical protein